MHHLKVYTGDHEECVIQWNQSKTATCGTSPALTDLYRELEVTDKLMLLVCLLWLLACIGDTVHLTD